MDTIKWVLLLCVIGSIWVLSANGNATLLLYEPFDYPAGGLTTVSTTTSATPLWTAHSVGLGDNQVLTTAGDIGN